MSGRGRHAFEPIEHAENQPNLAKFSPGSHVVTKVLHINIRRILTVYYTVLLNSCMPRLHQRISRLIKTL